MSRKEPVRVVVADEAPVNRSLIRYFLENDGFRVVGESSSADELVALAGSDRPDAVVIDDGLPGTNLFDTIKRIRKASPSTRIILFSSRVPSDASRALGRRGADAALEKGVGLKDLTPALTLLCGAPPATVPEVPAPMPIAIRPAPPPRRRRFLPRTGASAAVSLAVLAVLALVLLRAWSGGSPPLRPNPNPVASPTPAVEDLDLGVLYLDAAMGDLSDLLAAMPRGSFEEIVDLARGLMRGRTAALASGTDVSRLDALLAKRLTPSLLAQVSPRTAWVLVGILGPLLPIIDVGGLFAEPAEGGTGSTTGGGAGVAIDLTGGGGGSGTGGSGGGDATGGSGETTTGGGAATGPAGAAGNPGLHLGWEHKPPKGGWHYGWSHSHRKR